MSHIREVISSIHTTSATKQITGAMKMVAAAKLSKVQQQCEQLQQYADQLNALLRCLVTPSTVASIQDYTIKRPLKHMLVIVVSTSKGLCGALNNNLLKSAQQCIRDRLSIFPASDVTVMPIGRKSQDFFATQVFKRIEDHVDLLAQLTLVQVEDIVNKLITDFSNHIYDEILLVHGVCHGIAYQVPEVLSLLPIVYSPGTLSTHENLYIYEPSPQELLALLVPQWLQIRCYQAFLSASTSEHAARMTAMHKATDNAESLLKDLRLTYNRTRQAAITQELTEIVAGIGS